MEKEVLEYEPVPALRNHQERESSADVTSEASVSTEHSFYSVALIRVYFVTRDAVNCGHSDFMRVPDYGKLWKAARSCMKTERGTLQLYMDGKVITNFNAKRLILDIIRPYDCTVSQGIHKLQPSQNTDIIIEVSWTNLQYTRPWTRVPLMLTAILLLLLLLAGSISFQHKALADARLLGEKVSAQNVSILEHVASLTQSREQANEQATRLEEQNETIRRLRRQLAEHAANISECHATLAKSEGDANLTVGSLQQQLGENTVVISECQTALAWLEEGANATIRGLQQQLRERSAGISECQTALAQSEEDANVTIGRLQQMLGERAAAISECQVTLAQSEEGANATIGGLRQQLGQRNAGVAGCQAALVKSEEDANATIGRLRQQLGERAAASSECQLALAQLQDGVNVNIGSLRQQFDECIAGVSACQAALAKSEEDAKATIGSLRRQLGESAAASSECQLLLAQLQDGVNVTTGSLQQQLDECTAGVTGCEAALVKSEEDANATIGSLQQQLGESAAASSECQTVLAQLQEGVNVTTASLQQQLDENTATVSGRQAALVKCKEDANVSTGSLRRQLGEHAVSVSKCQATLGKSGEDARQQASHSEEHCAPVRDLRQQLAEYVARVSECEAKLARSNGETDEQAKRADEQKAPVGSLRGPLSECPECPADVSACHGALAASQDQVGEREEALAALRREVREVRTDCETANAWLAVEERDCRQQLQRARSKSEACSAAHTSCSADHEQGAAEVSESRARLEWLEAAYKACREQVTFKAPPRVSVRERVDGRVHDDRVTLHGTCADEEGGFLANAEWVQESGPDLRMNGAATKSVAEEIPPGLRRLSTELALTAFGRGTYTFSLRCTDGAGKTGRGITTLVIQHVQEPVAKIRGPLLVVESDASELSIECGVPRSTVSWRLWQMPKASSPGREYKGSGPLIDLSNLSVGSYNVSATCEEPLLRLQSKATRLVDIRSRGVLGFHLGTAHSCVSYDDGSGPQQVFIKDGGENDDDPCMPSCVAFDPADCAVSLGEPARRQAASNPANTFCDIIYLSGRRYSEVVQDLIASDIAAKCEYEQPGDECDKPVMRIACGGETRHAEAEQLSALMLSYMKAEAESTAGHSLGMSAVSVPAAWNNRQRRAMLDAAGIAGLDCQQLVNAPTAAVLHIAYKRVESAELGTVLSDGGTARPPRTKTIVVLNAGGGTTDVSVVYAVVSGGRFEVIGTSGSPVLAGADFDRAFADCALLPKLRSRLGQGDAFGMRSRAVLRMHAERLKVQLSSSSVATARIEWDKDGSTEKVVVTRAEFERCVSPLIEEQASLVAAAIKSAELEPEHVDEVYFVGGQAQIPLLQHRIQALFGNAVSYRHDDPRNAIVLGACRLVASRATGESLGQGSQRIHLAEVTQWQIGIAAADGEHPDSIEPLVRANGGLPLRVLKNFTSGEDRSIEVPVFEGPRDAVHASDPRSDFLGVFRIEGVLPHSTVEATFSVNANGMLDMSAVDRNSNQASGPLSVTLLSRDGHLPSEHTAQLRKLNSNLMSACVASGTKVPAAPKTERQLEASAWNCPWLCRIFGGCAAQCDQPEVQRNCALAVRGLQQRTVRPEWVPPSRLTQDQVSGLQYRAPAAHLDLVLLVESTRSVAGAISAAVRGIEEVATGVRAGSAHGRVRVAVLGYNYHGDAARRHVQDFTEDLAAVQVGVGAMEAERGGNGPGALLEALQNLDDLSYDAAAVKLVIHVAGDPPSGVEPDGWDATVLETLTPFAERLHAQSIRVFPVLLECRTCSSRHARSFYTALASATEGMAVALRKTEVLIPFISNLVSVVLENRHVTSEIMRMSRLYDETWTAKAKSKDIRRRLGGRARLRRLVLDGRAVTPVRQGDGMAPLGEAVGVQSVPLGASDIEGMLA